MKATSRAMLCIALWLSAGGCQNPCEELAKKYCDCYASRANRDACHTNMAVRKRYHSIQRTENQEACSEILANKTCTCRAIDEGRVDLCGMTRPTQQQANGDPDQ